MGADVIDADSIVHSLLIKDKVLKRKIGKLLGPDVFGRAGVLDRGKIRRKILDSPGYHRRYNALVHPRVKQEIKKRIAGRRGRCVVIDIPLLFETGWDRLIDVSVAVTAPEAARRIRGRKKGWSDRDFRFFTNAQMPLAEKVRRADFVIRNNTTRRKLKREVRNIWRKLQPEKKTQNTKR